MTRDLERVVLRATLLGAGLERIAEDGRAEPVLVVIRPPRRPAVPARRARIPRLVFPRGQDIEEVLRDGLLGRVAGELVAPRIPDDLRDVGVGVVPADVAVGAVEVVLPERERHRPLAVVEAQGRRQLLGVSGDAVQVEECLVHPAPLGIQHALPLQLAPLLDHALNRLMGPGRHAVGDLQRLRVAGSSVLVYHSCEHFVHNVERHADRLAVSTAVAARAHLRLVVQVLEGAHVERVDQTGLRASRVLPVRHLHLGERRHDQVAALLDARVLRVLVRHRRRGEVVPEVVPVVARMAVRRALGLCVAGDAPVRHAGARAGQVRRTRVEARQRRGLQVHQPVDVRVALLAQAAADRQRHFREAEGLRLEHHAAAQMLRHGGRQGGEAGEQRGGARHHLSAPNGAPTAVEAWNWN